MWPSGRPLAALPAATKLSLVAGGYAGALLLAFFSAWLDATLADPLDADASAGMQAFGDSLLFVGVFGFAATLPTLLALFFLYGPGARGDRT